MVAVASGVSDGGVITGQVDPEWTIELYTNWTATIDAFAGYNNTLAFTVANEVMNDSK